MKKAYTIITDEHGNETLLHGSKVSFDEQRKSYLEGKRPKGAASVTLLLDGSRARTKDYRETQVTAAPVTAAVGLETPKEAAARLKAEEKATKADVKAEAAEAAEAAEEPEPKHRPRHH